MSMLLSRFASSSSLRRHVASHVDFHNMYGIHLDLRILTQLSTIKGDGHKKASSELAQ
jgi:hypothetical protein